LDIFNKIWVREKTPPTRLVSQVGYGLDFTPNLPNTKRFYK